MWRKPSGATVRLEEAAVPPGVRVYAVGDIHGRADLLEQLHEHIRKDAADANHLEKYIIYIGDYIDRGVESRKVVDILLQQPLPGFQAITLKGNHEYALLKFMENPAQMAAWLSWGGDATIRSYGIELWNSSGKREDITVIAEHLNKKMPPTHKQFFSHLKLYHETGGYLFIHAGLVPDIPLEKQEEEDILMIRDEFIYHPLPFHKTVVFGHTIFEKPFHNRGKIAIDTGAYASGCLTAVVLEGTSVRFLNTLEEAKD